MIQKFKKGFTLIELLVVVAIIGILAGLVIVSVASARKKANNAKIKNDTAQVVNAVELHMSSSTGGALTGNAIQTTRGALTSTTGASTGHTYALVDDSGARLLPTAPKHPVSGKDYLWVTNAAGTNYAICGELADGTYFLGQSGATRDGAALTDCVAP